MSDERSAISDSRLVAGFRYTLEACICRSLDESNDDVDNDDDEEDDNDAH